MWGAVSYIITKRGFQILIPLKECVWYLSNGGTYWKGLQINYTKRCRLSSQALASPWFNPNLRAEIHSSCHHPNLMHPTISKCCLSRYFAISKNIKVKLSNSIQNLKIPVSHTLLISWMLTFKPGLLTTTESFLLLTLYALEFYPPSTPLWV